MNHYLILPIIVAMCSSCIKFKNQESADSATSSLAPSPDVTSNSQEQVADNSGVLKKAKTYVLPEKNNVPISLESLCTGIMNTMQVSDQEFTEEASVLCPDGLPSTTLTALMSNPFVGQGNPATFITNINPAENVTGNNLQIFITYGMKFSFDPVKVLLGEEKHVTVPYDRGILAISGTFMAPPINNNEADTAFAIQQTTDVNRVLAPQVIFNDVTTHKLKMYRVYPNNFDFFLAVRTLDAPSEQFSKSVVLRAVMEDPQDPNSTYVFTVLNFIMNSRGDPNGQVGQGMRDEFTAFVRRDMETRYSGQSN